MQNQNYMQIALLEAKQAAARGEVPIGAVVVDASGKIIAQAGNRTEEMNDPSAHAEFLALRDAAQKTGAPRLVDCDLYVTLEPCTMCAAAISQFRVRRLYYGAYDPKGGAVDHGVKFFASPTCHHAPEIYGGIMESETGAILRDFFESKRA